MLDVHPPHAPTHTWRDFCIHIATICVGLLIALGLEQSVEAIHLARERADLREALAHESQQILTDCQAEDRMTTADIAWDTALEQQLSDAGRLHLPVGPMPPFPSVGTADLPDDPIFRAAAASDELTLLSRPETEVYSEVNQLVVHYLELSRNYADANGDFTSFLQAQSFGRPLQTPPFTNASPEDLKKAYDLLGRRERATRKSRSLIYELRAAELAIASGERDLQKIYIAERHAAYQDSHSSARPAEKK